MRAVTAPGRRRRTRRLWLFLLLVIVVVALGSVARRPASVVVERNRAYYP
jgi:hypothetical protein